MITMGIMLASGAAAAYLLLQEKKNGGEKPPKNAPQLDIDNPGTQADFPSSATESEVG